MSYKYKLTIVINIFILFFCSSLAAAETDKRVFHHTIHTVNPKEASIFIDFTDINQISHPLKVWDGLWVKINNINNSRVSEGVYGYSVRFASDSEFNNIFLPTNQPRRGITANTIAAFHFRNSNNSGPNEAGPMNVNAPQEVRLIKYADFDAEIRILNFEITGIGSSESVPSFAGIQFLITVTQKKQ